MKHRLWLSLVMAGIFAGGIMPVDTNANQNSHDVFAAGDNLRLSRPVQLVPAFRHIYASRYMEKNPEFMQAMVLFYTGKFQESGDIFQQLYDARPGDETGIAAYFYFSETLRRRGRENNALYHYLDFFRRYPDHFFADDCLYGLGRLYFDRKDYSTAASFFGRIVTEYPHGTAYEAADAMLLYINYVKNVEKSDSSDTITVEVPADDSELRAALARLKEKEDALELRIAAVDAREAALVSQQEELEALQKRLQALDLLLRVKEKNLDAREQALNAKEEALDAKEQELIRFENP